MGAPAAISPWRNPGASDRGQRPRCSDRTSLSPMRMSRRLTSTSTWESPSKSEGEPPRAADTRNKRSWRSLSGWTDSPGPRQQAPQLVHAGELAHGVEAPVQDAVAGLKVCQEPLQGLAGSLRLRGEVAGLGLLQLLPHRSQAGRVLPDEQLHRKVQGVERPGERPQLGFVDLQAHQLAHAQLHAVQPHRAVVFEVGQHEEQGQVGWRLGRRLRGLLRSGIPGLRLLSAAYESFKCVLQLGGFLCSRVSGRTG